MARFCANLFGAGRRFDLVPREPTATAFGAYLRAPTGIRHGTGLYVLTLTATGLRHDPWRTSRFGLPQSLPANSQLRGLSLQHAHWRAQPAAQLGRGRRGGWVVVTGWCRRAEDGAGEGQYV